MSRPTAMPSPAETEVELCPAPKGSYSLSARFVKPVRHCIRLWGNRNIQSMMSAEGSQALFLSKQEETVIGAEAETRPTEAGGAWY